MRLLPAISIVLLLAFKPVEDDIITWNAERPLTWDDFRGKPAKRFSAASTTYDILQTVQEDTRHTASVNIRAVFFCNKSWKKVSWINNSVLVHEQKHFDIAELYARELRKRVQQAKYNSFEDLKRKADSIYAVVDKEMDVYQDKYDEETDASMNGEKQREWNQEILNEIAKLDEWKDTVFKVSYTRN